MTGRREQGIVGQQGERGRAEGKTKNECEMGTEAQEVPQRLDLYQRCDTKAGIEAENWARHGPLTVVEQRVSVDGKLDDTALTAGGSNLLRGLRISERGPTGSDASRAGEACPGRFRVFGACRAKFAGAAGAESPEPRGMGNRGQVTQPFARYSEDVHSQDAHKCASTAMPGQVRGCKRGSGSLE